jgi:hypothetical protein
MRKPYSQSPSVDALYPCANSAEFFFDAFVTAIDVIDVIDVGCVLATRAASIRERWRTGCRRARR